MGYKALRYVCPHPDHKDEKKTFWKEIGTAMMDEELAAFMKDKNYNIRLLPNDSPGLSYMIFPPKEFNDDPGDGKGGKW